MADPQIHTKSFPFASLIDDELIAIYRGSANMEAMGELYPSLFAFGAWYLF